MGKREMDAWAAGLFDADGCVRIAKQRRKDGTRYVLRTIVVQAGYELPEVIRRLQDEYGGSVSRRKGRGTRQPQWELMTASKTAHAFLTRIAPYSVVKKRQIDLAIEFREKTLGSRDNDLREMYRKRISALKGDR